MCALVFGAQKRLVGIGIVGHHCKASGSMEGIVSKNTFSSWFVAKRS